MLYEKFQYDKCVIRSRKSKDRQCKGKKERKPQTMIYKTLHRKITIGLHLPRMFDIVKGLFHKHRGQKKSKTTHNVIFYGNVFSVIYIIF